MDTIIDECAGNGILIQTSPKEVRPMPNQVGVVQAVRTSEEEEWH